MKYNESVPTKIHLQKEIFILQRKYPFNENKCKYDFVPLYYGPFSTSLNLDLMAGIEDGLINDSYGLTLTENGFACASKIWNMLNDESKITIIQTKERFNRMKTDALLDYVYTHYPKFSRKSALLRKPVDNYFTGFWNENNLSDDYFVQIVREYRELND